MTAKKTVINLLSLIFVIFSLQFIRDAFYKWDGYSYYLEFAEFLPELSLAFIIWTFVSIFTSLAIWSVSLLLFSMLKRTFKFISIEHIAAFFLILLLLFFLKLDFFKTVSLTGITGFNHVALFLIGALLIAVFLFLAGRYIEKIISVIVARITPLVLIFSFLFIVAIPLSFFNAVSGGTDGIVGDSQAVSVRQSSSPQSFPNIIIVSMDSLSARNMQAYGYDRPTTPFISKWADDALLFKRVYSPSNWTSSSVMSLMTSQRVWTHGVWHFVANRHISDSYSNNLPRLLSEAGYDIYGFVQNSHAHPDKLGIHDAFKASDEHNTCRTSSKKFFYGLSEHLVSRPIVKDWIFSENLIAEQISIFSPDFVETVVPPGIVYDRFLQLIDKTGQAGAFNGSQKPYFAYIHVYPPHDPFLPPNPYRGMFGDTGKFASFKTQREPKLLYSEYPPARQPDVDIFENRYDEFVAYSDKQFEVFISQISEKVDITNTILIMTSDHGEIFSHGYAGHAGRHFFEPMIHVPMIIKFPEHYEESLGGMGVIDMPVSQIDVAPTLLELINLPVPEWMEGRSFLPLLKGGRLEPLPIYSMQFKENRLFGNPITKGTVAIVDGGYKFINYLEDDRVLLFNLRQDPNETNDLSEEEPEVVERFKRLIDQNIPETDK